MSASDLAGGSQDLAALLGLFATDGVERNALASHLGWGCVVASSLSLLGILGLVKSSIKVALGLRYCWSAGFNLDSLRGIFGFLPGESPTLGNLFDCDVMMIQFSTQGLRISVSKRYFSGDYTPIVKVASAQGWARGINVNLGNLRGEKAFNKSPILIAFALFICSGLTTWLLEVVQAEWTWVKIVAIPGLHLCLFTLVAIPLWYDKQVNHPGTQLTVEKWNALHDLSAKNWNPPDGEGVKNQTLNLLQVRHRNTDVLHCWANTAFLKSPALKGTLIFASVFAATAYICQYTILKAASSMHALIWIGCQAALAAARLAYWIFNPSFDNPSVVVSEFAELNNTASEQVTLPELICNTFAGPSLQIPPFALVYLGTNPLQEILYNAASRSKNADAIPVDAEIVAFLNTDFRRLIERRWVEGHHDSFEQFRLALCRVKNQAYPIPLVLVDVPYRNKDGDEDMCWMEATWPSRDHHATCTSLAFARDGGRLHLRSTVERCDENCIWRQRNISGRNDHRTPQFLDDRSRKICEWLRRLAKAENFYIHIQGAWRRTVTVLGEAHRGEKQDKRPEELDYQKGLGEVREYIRKGLQSPPEMDFLDKIRWWLLKKSPGPNHKRMVSEGDKIV
ncbi:hypothetical protein OEA41_006046 [Lepraria neglecta]|uniref:Uncharacterized protein n=1 Tax=Lepraria neglecta TaxID=209136 RepID=A0AAE0DJV9_9LECA|nr:hypothetical protein OEA41_006046 [Lepraria neglecta]